jgi:lysophosphatidylglycerol acyltransferase 1
MTTWLYERFIEKERILEAYYTTGQFPYREFSETREPPQVVRQDPLRFLILHLFFITSTYVHFQLLSYLMTLLW